MAGGTSCFLHSDHFLFGYPEPFSGPELLELLPALRFSNASSEQQVKSVSSEGLELPGGITISMFLKPIFLHMGEGMVAISILESPGPAGRYQGAGPSKEDLDSTWWLLLQTSAPGSGEALLDQLSLAGALRPNMLLDDHPNNIGGWKLKQQIGVGSFSAMFQMKRKVPVTQATVNDLALKVVEASKDEDTCPPRLQHELQALMLVRGHPHVVGLRGVFLTTVDDILCWALAMELGGHGSVLEMASQNQLPERMAQVLFTGLFAGLEHLHSKDLVHRDLQPKSLLVVSLSRAMICSFASCSLVTDQLRMAQRVIVPGFTAPEVRGMPKLIG